MGGAAGEFGFGPEELAALALEESAVIDVGRILELYGQNIRGQGVGGMKDDLGRSDANGVAIL